MPLTIPTLDDRNYNQILAEALARIPVHNPEWTNFNDSDPGVTLLQLFAFMTENLLYRSNLIPERNRKKFLQLLRIPMQPAAAAQGLVSFSNLRGPLQVETLTAGLDLFAGPVPFRLLDGLDVLPIESRIYYKAPLAAAQFSEVDAIYRQLYESFADESSGEVLSYYETKPLEAPTAGADFPAINLASNQDTVDGSLWVALLARDANAAVIQQTREAIAHKVLTLGVLPSLTAAEHVLLPGGPPSTANQGGLTFQMPLIPAGGLPLNESERVAHYRSLDVIPSADLLTEPGVVQIPLPGSSDLTLWPNLEPMEQGSGDFPPYLEDTDVQARVITWLRVGLRRDEAQVESTNQLHGSLSWLGVNTARISQRVHLFSENVGQGSGEPDQILTLVNTPVLKGTVQLTVNGELWQETDDLLAAGPEVPVRAPQTTPGSQPMESAAQPTKVFTLDRESGELRFGDGLRGMRPPRGAVIRASYDYGGGRQGNVGIGAINKGPSLPAGVKVANPIPTWGGDEAETVTEAERRIPTYLQHRDRLVSQADFKTITWRTPGVDLGRVEVLALHHPEIPDVLSDGVVTVLVIPLYDQAQPEAPVPDRLFLDTVCQYLDPRRVITTEVHVRGPAYVPIWVSVGIDVAPGQNVAPIREAVKEILRQFLSPLTGGFEGSGWPLQKPVEPLELLAVAARVPGVAKVNSVLVALQTGGAQTAVPLTGLQLPRLAGLAVQSGSPQPLDDLRGGAAPPPTTKVTPVPVLPAECL